MEHAPSEVSEAYSDVFEEEIPEQSADDDASDAASVRSAMTLARSQEDKSDQHFQYKEAYIQGEKSTMEFNKQSSYCNQSKPQMCWKPKRDVFYAGPAETYFTSVPTNANTDSKPGSIRSAGIRHLT